MAEARFPTAELKRCIDNHDVRISVLEQGAVERRERIENLRRDVDRICGDIEDSEKWRDDVNKILTKSVGAMDTGKWLLLVFGGSVIGLIWSLIVGTAQIIFK